MCPKGALHTPKACFMCRRHASFAAHRRRGAQPPPKNKLDRRNFPLCFWAQFTHFLFKVRQKIKNKFKILRKKRLARVFAALKKAQAAFSAWKIKIQIKFFPDTFVTYIVIIFAPLVNKNAAAEKNMCKNAPRQ